MIKGFEDITEPLSQYELETLVPLIVKGLNRHRGRTKAITGANIVYSVNRYFNLIEEEKCEKEGKAFKKKTYIDLIRLRKCINYIRNSNHDYFKGAVVCSGRRGYFVSSDENIITKCINSLEDRLKTQTRTVHSLKKGIDRLRERKQSTLF